MQRTIPLPLGKIEPARWPFSLLLVASVQLVWAAALLAFIASTAITPNPHLLSESTLHTLDNILNLGKHPLSLLLLIPAAYHFVFGFGLLGLKPWARRKLAASCGIAVCFFARELMMYTVTGEDYSTSSQLVAWDSADLRGLLYARIAVYALSFLILMFHPSVIEAFPPEKK